MFANRLRKTVIRIATTSVAVSCMAMALHAQDKVGTSAAPFLGIPIGPRAAAMGGAFSAVADDATSIYWNPAGIAGLGKSHVIVSHSNWLVNTNFNWAGVVLTLDNANALAFSLTQLDYGEEDVTTVQAQNGTGDRWSAQDLAVTISYARAMTDRFSIGGSFKYIQEKIYNSAASAIAFDVGLVFVTQFNELRLGMSITNFGSDMTFDGKDLLQRIDIDPKSKGNNETLTAKLKTDAWPLPLFFRVGLAYDLLRQQNMKLTLAGDVLRPSDNSGVLNLGAEFGLYNLLFLRAGYQSLFRDSTEEGLTAGVGFKFSAGSAGQLYVDFAYADYGLLDSVKMFSLGLGF